MEHLKKFNESFVDSVKKFGKNVGDTILGKDIEVPKLDDTTKKYTEQDLFDATEESFKVGYMLEFYEEGADTDRIRSASIMNRHKKWFLKIKNLKNFKR